MTWLHLLYQLPAIVAGTTLVSYMSPVKIAHRALPLIMFLVSLIVLALPVFPDLAMALTLPAAWLANFLGISLTGHEPVNVGPAVEKARAGVQAARERIRPAKPVEVTPFVDRAYPAPGDAAELEAADADAAVVDDDLDDAPEDQEPVSPADQMSEKLANLTRDPRMPREAAVRLAGQRPGKMSQPGLRDQHAPVRSFVPAL
jgi:hypothetical protein